MAYIPLPLLIAAAVFDWRTRRVPNQLTYSMAVLGLAVQTLTGGVSSFLGALGGLALAMFVFNLLPGFHLGGGDWKLSMAVGAWVETSGILWFIFLTLLGILGGNLALSWREEGPGGLARKVVVEVKTAGLISRPFTCLPAAPFMLAAYTTIVVFGV